MTPGVEPPMTKPSAVSRMPISSGILFVSTISSGRVRPDRSCTKRSVPPASTLAIPEAPAKILTASSTLVGAAKLRLGMFAPEIARAQFRGPRGMTALRSLGLHYHPLRREELCSNASLDQPTPAWELSGGLDENRETGQRIGPITANDHVYSSRLPQYADQFAGGDDALRRHSDASGV